MAAGGGEAQGWFPDPFGRFELRYFDGGWTDCVKSNGRRRRDPPGGGSPVPTVACDPEVIRRRVADLEGEGDGEAGGTLLTAPVLVYACDQHLQPRSDFAIFDRDGRQLGGVREVGAPRRAPWRFLLGPFLDGGHLQVVDAAGDVVVAITRSVSPLAVVLRATFTVKDPRGRELATISQSGFGQMSVARPGGTAISVHTGTPGGREFVVRDSRGRPMCDIATSRDALASVIPFRKGTVVSVVRVLGPLDAETRRLLLAVYPVLETARQHVDTLLD